MVFNSIKNKIKVTEPINISYICENKIEKYNKAHEVKHFAQLPSYLSKEEKNIDYIINCSSKNDDNSIPIIIINEKEYDNFKKMLVYLKGYEKFKNDKILNSKFIFTSKEINKSFHLN